jgi:hypothetical protein
VAKFRGEMCMSCFKPRTILWHAPAKIDPRRATQMCHFSHVLQDARLRSSSLLGQQPRDTVRRVERDIANRRVANDHQSPTRPIVHPCL